MTLSRRRVILTVMLAVTAVATVTAWRYREFIVPTRWSDEPARLAAVLGVRAGDTIADVGAGDGSLAVQMARFVGPTGTVYATEMEANQRDTIRARAEREGATRLQVVAAAARSTNLPAACCDAVYLRMVFHHIDDRHLFARSIVDTLKPGGRIAIIDFAPGSAWLLAGDHGITAQEAIDAFAAAGATLTQRIDDWSGDTYLLRFERASSPQQTQP